MKKERSDVSKNRIAIFVILFFAVVLFMYLFFSTNLINQDVDNVAQIKKIQKQLDDINIPDIPESQISGRTQEDQLEVFQIPSVPGLEDYDFIAHEIYTSFAEALFYVDGGVLSISDKLIYDTAYYSVNGEPWQEITLTGNRYEDYDFFLDDAQAILPNELNDEGTHFIIVFSCSLVNNAWDCHGDAFDNTNAKWQLDIFERGDPGCTPNCGGRECGSDGCDGICGSCSGSTPYCSNGQCVSGGTPGGGLIIADHNAANAYESVPQCWIDRAKQQLNIAYEHTSHGEQIVQGLQDVGHYSGFDFDDEFMGGGRYDLSVTSNWDDLSRNYLNSHPDVNVMMWSWCNIAGHDGDVTNYLNEMNALRSEYPNVQFVYMTGHLDGGGPSGSVWQLNNRIRDRVRSSQGILFDFADIETYDPSGGYHPGDTDTCNWCGSWCSGHSSPGCDGSRCTHSRDINCYQKGKALVWMFARMAGWDGVSQTC